MFGLGWKLPHFDRVREANLLAPVTSGRVVRDGVVDVLVTRAWSAAVG
jgi:hypothetical protein